MVLFFDQAGLVDEGLAGVILFETKDVLQDLYTEKVCLFGFIQARPELRNVAQRDASSIEQPVVFNLISCANPDCSSLEHSMLRPCLVIFCLLLHMSSISLAHTDLNPQSGRLRRA